MKKSTPSSTAQRTCSSNIGSTRRREPSGSAGSQTQVLLRLPATSAPPSAAVSAASRTARRLSCSKSSSRPTTLSFSRWA